MAPLVGALHRAQAGDARRTARRSRAVLSSVTPAIGTARRGYLDWLRGVGVLIMIEAHTLDSWTQVSERGRTPFTYSLIIGGIGAPIFLFLAGIAIALAAGARVRRGASARQAAASTRARGWQIFGLAFLFRLQAVILSGGALITLLKVDILNVMGVAMIVAATLWGIGRGGTSRTLLLAGAAVAMALLTPIVRSSWWIVQLPDPLEWYLRPVPDRTTFTLFPWAGFLFAGTAVGIWLDRARSDDAERRLVLLLAVLGPAMALAGYAASLLPPIYAHTNFWTSSPTFFVLRLGVLLALIPLAYAIARLFPRASGPLEEFGRASLFVYWIHVEMVYGAMSAAIHRRLTFEQAVVAFLIFSVFLFGLARLKNAVLGQRRSALVMTRPPGAASQ